MKKEQMLEMLRLFRLIRRQEHYKNLKLEIAAVLRQLSFSDWWSYTNMFGLKEIERLNCMSDLCDSLASDDSIEITAKEAYEKLNKIFPSGHQLDRLGEDGDELYSLFQRKRLVRIKDRTKYNYSRFLLWTIFSNAIRLQYRVTYRNRRINSKNTNVFNDVEKNLSKAEEYLSKIASEATDVSLRKTTIEYKNLSKIAKRNIKILQALEKYNADQTGSDTYSTQMMAELKQDIIKAEEAYNNTFESQFRKTSKLLPFLLNTMLIPYPFQEKIVEVVRNSVFKRSAQNFYDKFKSIYADAIDYRFFNIDVISTNSMLQSDFDKIERREKRCLLCNLNRESLTLLYNKLIECKYISSDTDIIDFAFALTGKPHNRTTDFHHINWLGEQKQSLAIFLGMLRKYEPGSKFWEKAVHLFLFNGLPSRASQLSTPFGKLTNKPETRGDDWQKLEKIFSSLE